MKTGEVKRPPKILNEGEREGDEAVKQTRRQIERRICKSAGDESRDDKGERKYMKSRERKG